MRQPRCRESRPGVCASRGTEERPHNRAVIMGPQCVLARDRSARMGPTQPETPLFSGERGGEIHWEPTYPAVYALLIESAATVGRNREGDV